MAVLKVTLLLFNIKVTEGEATKLEALVQALHQATEDTMLAKEGAHE